MAFGLDEPIRSGLDDSGWKPEGGSDDPYEARDEAMGRYLRYLLDDVRPRVSCGDTLPELKGE